MIPKVQRAKEALELAVLCAPEAGPRVRASVSPPTHCQGNRSPGEQGRDPPQLRKALWNTERRQSSWLTAQQLHRQTGVKYSYSSKRLQTSKHTCFSTEQQKELDFVTGLRSVFAQLRDVSIL